MGVLRSMDFGKGGALRRVGNGFMTVGVQTLRSQRAMAEKKSVLGYSVVAVLLLFFAVTTVPSVSEAVTASSAADCMAKLKAWCIGTSIGGKYALAAGDYDANCTYPRSSGGSQVCHMGWSGSTCSGKISMYYSVSGAKTYVTNSVSCGP